ncbi:MAG: hypothetical protein U5M72_07310 [Pseudomonas sp.]|nr:hypothetical protein [Pseudomonas sp.]
MNLHAQIGYDILHDEQRSPLTDLLRKLPFPITSVGWQWLPNGLKGEEIPLSGRIVALCDVYDALRSPRSYKQAWSAERAQAYILENAGGHFDPHLVQVMSSVFTELEDLQLTMADRAEPFTLSPQHD